MKNIHLLPTDKPSKIIKSQDNDFILLNTDAPNWFEINLKTTKQNIYITSDEEIKEGDWFIALVDDSYDIYKAFEVLMNIVKENKYLQRKIIITTDQDLIKDGVQAIPDEFLEWFVNNPSCENVEVKSLKTIPALQLTGNNHCMYQLIIPKEEPKKDEIDRFFVDMVCNSKEEPKQETLEEFANKAYPFYGDVELREAIELGAKWQQEQCKKDLDAHLDVAEDLWLQVVKQNKKLYSEEEVRKIVWESRKFFHEYKNTPFNKVRQVFYEWFKQFKKK